jgi:NADP-dependent 3-hydroxy acid dehydrogenase YdfG
MSEIRFDGRVAVITGAGGGLGKTYATMLASRGASVVVNDLGGAADGTGGGSSMADQTVKEILEAGGKAVANYDSVATPEGGANIIQAAVDNFGKVDILINNAGILRDKSFAKLEPQNLDAVLDVHLRGGFFVTQPAFRVMKENNYGRIVFAASGAGIFGNFGQANYGAARLTEQLLGPVADALDPNFITPLETYLCSEDCELTHEIFDIGGGRYARIFIGLGDGWTAPKDTIPSPEDIAANLGQIRSTEGYTIPDSIAGETQAIIEALKARG